MSKVIGSIEFLIQNQFAEIRKIKLLNFVTLLKDSQYLEIN